MTGPSIRPRDAELAPGMVDGLGLAGRGVRWQPVMPDAPSVVKSRADLAHLAADAARAIAAEHDISITGFAVADTGVRLPGVAAE